MQQVVMSLASTPTTRWPGGGRIGLSVREVHVDEAATAEAGAG
jgi:hypothetical protein